MKILELLENEIYRLMEIEQKKAEDCESSYCTLCKHERNYKCFAETPMQCPAVKEEVNRIEGYLWGLREFKESLWLRQ